jgi:hypothetical protein
MEKHCGCNSTCWRDWWTRALIRFQRDLAIELTMFAKHTALSKLLMKWKSLPKGKACSCASLAHKCKCRYVTGSKCNKTDEKRTAHKMLWHSPNLPFIQYWILLKPQRDLLSQTLHLEIENYNGDYNQQKLENMTSEGSRRMGTFPNHRQLPKRDWRPLICSPRAST